MLLSGHSVLALHLLHFIWRHHRDDDVPVPVICSGKSSWLRLLLVCHHLAWQLSTHLLLVLDACHCRTPLNCECESGVNIIISLASGSPDKHFAGTHWHTQWWCTSLPAEKAPSGISHWFLVRMIFYGHENNPCVPAPFEWASNSLIYVQIKGCTLQSDWISRDTHRTATPEQEED